MSNETLLQKKDDLKHFMPLAKMISWNNTLNTYNNTTSLFINGEEKFPEVLKSISKAKHHIHLQYYIYENDTIGTQIGDLLIQKAQEGVEVRVIYDDLGSKKLQSKFLKRLKDAGVKVAPFFKIKFLVLANRVNYRNHRKIIVIDGLEGYVGGINVSDKYINNGKHSLYWRDTHVKIVGAAVMNLQYIFLTDWNFCAKKSVPLSDVYFPIQQAASKNFGSHLVQITASGPDSDYQDIMYSLISAITLSKKEICLTTPYFIPEKSFTDALKIAKMSGVDVKILVPGISDSVLVNITSNSYYEDLLKAGIKIYKYQKGFVHAKTMVCDDLIAMVGTANLDQRSFDLNFEVNALIYDAEFAKKLRIEFYKDLEHADELDLETWLKRPFYTTFAERIMRLVSPLM
ncbi:cardiolipin synthase [Tenacibaculum tangerinum]|uniref:Cardiolipin synthase n=1 Tax=Tenacibaculum tangerinum TaxID=3038772 RepID=A0ABY8L6U1_9FLAO|nr:cardiolipin synthase [Tenacibaculum tangerinum]